MKITDIVAVVFMTALGVSLLVRLSVAGRRPGKTLLWAQVVAIGTLILSLSPVFPAIDPLFGGQSYLNLISHLSLVIVYALYGRAIALPLLGTQRVPFPLTYAAYAISAVGTIVCFFALDVTMSSRGLDDYAASPWWLAYWVFSTMGLWFAAFTMIRLLRSVGVHPVFRPLKASYRFMALGYLMSVIMLAGYVAAWVWPSLIPVREGFVSATQLCLVMSLILVPFATHERAGRTQNIHKTTQRK